MLKVQTLAALTLFVCVFSSLGPSLAKADPSVSDDGSDVVGRIDMYSSSQERRREQLKKEFRVFYRDEWLTLPQYRDEAARCEASGGRDCAALDSVDIRQTAEQTAVSLVARLRLPDPTPQFGPDPNVNEWKMLAVGFPVWLWTKGSAELTTSVSSGGETFILRARRRSVSFEMGDGRGVVCHAMTPYSRSVKPGTPSPTCGYSYQRPSLPFGSYTVRSTVAWEVSWSVAGYAGVLPTTRTAARVLPIGELFALNR